MAFTFKVDASLGTYTQITCNGIPSTVDWGDGSPIQVLSGALGHTYPTSNVYTATLTPVQSQFIFTTNNIIEITCTSNNVVYLGNYSNNLTGITVDNCVNLSTLQIYSAINIINLNVNWASLNSLTFLEISFSKINYETLEIDNDHVVQISFNYSDLSENLILTGCTNLSSLSTYNATNIKNIDISTCSKIYELGFNNCQSLTGVTFPNPWNPINPSNNIQLQNTGLKNITIENFYYSSGYIYFYINDNLFLETLTFENSKCLYFNCYQNLNLKTVSFNVIDASGVYFSNNNSLESIVGNTNSDYTYLGISDNLVLTNINVLNYVFSNIGISNNTQLSDLQLPNSNINQYYLNDNSLNLYNFINFSTVETIELQGNNFNSSTLTSLLEAGYLSGAVNVFLNIQTQDTLFTPSQNALSFIDLLTNTRGWTILYNISPYPTYAGQLDTTFNEGNNGPNDMVFIIKKQTDGKILIGGDFNNYDYEYAARINRLNPDGSIDNTFFSGASFNDNVFAIELQGDKILVGGSFNYYDPQDTDIQVTRIARLNSDGSLDNTFPTGNTFNNIVRVIKLQPDGKILVGGNFSTYDDGTGSLNYNGLIRLNPDGTVDTSFIIGDGFETNQNGNVYSIIVQDDGKIVVGGWFNTYDGNTANRIVRLNPDGSNDFTMGDSGFNNRVSRIIQQPDGKFLCVGFFNQYTGTSYNRIIRFNPDGNVDITFQNNNLDWEYIQAIEILDTGKILIGGSSDSGYVNFYMLNSDGTISDDLTILGGFDGQVNYILQQDHNKVLVGGWFSQYQGIPVNYLARLWLYDPFSIPISAGTEVFICDIDCSGGTVTTSVEHPTWTNLYGQAVIQQDAITLAGNNGYNS